MTHNESHRRHALVIAFYFPPMGLSGVQRTAKFVKYLHRYGWHATVLTVEPRGYLAKDESLLAELDPAHVRIVRTKPAGPARLWAKRKEIVSLPSERTRRIFSKISDTFFIPDNKIGWKRRAVRRALALHAETPFDLIFATAPPFTSFLVGLDIKAKINKPLVFDYRDPWFDYPFKFYPTRLHRWANAALERRALRASSHVITTNRRVKELLISRNGFLTYHDIDIIPQGFDPEDYEDAHSSGSSAASSGRGEDVLKPAGKMRITYAGIFWEDRVPDHFLQALHDLIVEIPRLRGRIEAVFIGTFREENRRLVAKLGLQDAVIEMGYLPHPECVRELRRSDVLWMIIGDDRGSPGKTYEYIGARKPILACAPEGFIKQTVLEAGGTVVAPTDVAGIKKALLSFHERFERNELVGPPEEVVRRYDRSVLTGILVKLFESLVES